MFVFMSVVGCVGVCENGCCVVAVVKNSVHSRWWLIVRESSLGVCSEVCPVCFPIFRECVSVLLYPALGACVDCCDYGKVI